MKWALGEAGGRESLTHLQAAQDDETSSAQGTVSAAARMAGDQIQKRV